MVLLLDLDGLDNNWLSWAVHAVSGGGCDGCNDLLRLRISNLTEDGVSVVQVWGWSHSDEELGTIGTRARISHSQEEWAIEAELWVELILELVARAATAGAGWVAALNHEAVDDAVEDRTVVERALSGARSVLGLVVSGTVSQGDEVLYCLWSVVAKELDLNVTVVGVHDCSCSLETHEAHSRQGN